MDRPWWRHRMPCFTKMGLRSKEGAVALCRLLEVGMRPCVRLIPVPVLTPVSPKANLSHPELGRGSGIVPNVGNMNSPLSRCYSIPGLV